MYFIKMLNFSLFFSFFHNLLVITNVLINRLMYTRMMEALINRILHLQLNAHFYRSTFLNSL